MPATLSGGLPLPSVRSRPDRTHLLPSDSYRRFRLRPNGRGGNRRPSEKAENGVREFTGPADMGTSPILRENGVCRLGLNGPQTFPSPFPLSGGGVGCPIWL